MSNSSWYDVLIGVLALPDRFYSFDLSIYLSTLLIVA